MGHYCPTAHFLREALWRHETLPLDWCANTFKLWHHMLEDNFRTFLRNRIPGQRHPYNSMFEDCMMFMHDGTNGWANDKTHERVQRLRGVLGRGHAVGLAFYFSGDANVRAPLEEVIADAEALLNANLEHGFSRIILVWFAESAADPPTATWVTQSARLSVLHYTPVQSMYWGSGHCCNADIDYLRKYLLDELPDIFSRVPLATRREQPAAPLNDVTDNEQWHRDQANIRRQEDARRARQQRARMLAGAPAAPTGAEAHSSDTV